MAPAALKLASSSEADLSLNSFPQFISEREKLRQIAAEYDEIEAERKDLTGALAKLSAARAAEIDAAARDRVAGKQLPDRSAIAAKLDSLNFRSAAAREALFQQNEIFAAVKSEYAALIIERAAPADAQRLRDIVEQAEKLADMIDAALDHRRALNREMATLLTVWPPLQWFADKIGSRKCWRSNVNALARAAADHIRRPWDHSHVTY
jgi:hypothetical protein